MVRVLCQIVGRVWIEVVVTVVVRVEKAVRRWRAVGRQMEVGVVVVHCHASAQWFQ